MARNPVDDVISFVSVRKANPRDWAFLHIRLSDMSQGFGLADVEKTLQTRLSGMQYEIFMLHDKGEIFMVADNRGRAALSQFDKAILERFGGSSMRSATFDLTEKGMDYLFKTLSRHIADGDKPAKIALARMARPSNTILVLDDDPMVLKSMEMVLKGFGFVGVYSTPEEFLARYLDYAPNMVFVDIHLKGYKGPAIVKALRSQYDPHVHAIMISADATQETVMSVRECGAKGYIVKPINREAVFQNVMKAPTFVPKTV